MSIYIYVLSLCEMLIFVSHPINVHMYTHKYFKHYTHNTHALTMHCSTFTCSIKVQEVGSLILSSQVAVEDGGFGSLVLQEQPAMITFGINKDVSGVGCVCVGGGGGLRYIYVNQCNYICMRTRHRYAYQLHVHAWNVNIAFLNVILSIVFLSIQYLHMQFYDFNCRTCT